MIYRLSGGGVALGGESDGVPLEISTILSTSNYELVVALPFFEPLLWGVKDGEF